MHDDIAFWDKAAQKYAASPINDIAGYERTLERMWGLLKPTDRVVEIGCGTGTTALRLATLGASYLATDPSPAMIAIANDKLAITPQSRLSFAVATAEDLAGRLTQRDVALCFNALHLVPNLDRALGAILRIIAPGGLFVSKTPCVGAMNVLIRAAIPVARLVGKAPHVATFTADQLEAALLRAGFVIEAVEYHASKGRDVRPFILARKP